jgi:hypothetical protein
MKPRLVSAAKEIRDECGRDYVGLWWLPGTILQHIPDSTEAERKQLSLEIVEALLADPKITVGQFRDRVFQPWSLQPAEAYNRISREWCDLGREPNLGEICWFVER